MRVMLMHKYSVEVPPDAPPPLEVIQKVGRMVQDAQAAGIMLDGAGLRPSSLGVRLNFSGGERRITEGPLTPRAEFPAAFAVLRVRSRDEAVEIGTRFAALLGDGEMDVRPVTEPWHLGFGEAPKDDPTTRWMIVWKADARSESGSLPSIQLRASIGKLIADLTSDGILLGGEVLRPGKETKRSLVINGRRSVIDGPFAESKELISGFITLDLPSLEAALPWAERYVEAVGDIELDIRPLYEPAELGG